MQKDNEEEVVIKIPTNEDKKIAAFVEVYVDGETDLTEVNPGTVVNFKFTGAAVSTGDKIEIDMNSTLISTTVVNGKSNTQGRIGLVGSDITDNKNGQIETTLPENGIVSIVLYDANVTDKTFVYNFNGGYNGTDNNNSAVLINGVRPVWLYLRDDSDTDDVKELNASDKIEMVKLDDNSIAKVRINVTTDIGGGDGSADDKRKSLPQIATVSNQAIKLGTKVANKPVLTGFIL